MGRGTHIQPLLRLSTSGMFAAAALGCCYCRCALCRCCFHGRFQRRVVGEQLAWCDLDAGCPVAVLLAVVCLGADDGIAAE